MHARLACILHAMLALLCKHDKKPGLAMKARAATLFLRRVYDLRRTTCMLSEAMQQMLQVPL